MIGEYESRSLHSLTDEALVKLVTERRILRMAATILHLEAFYDAANTCTYVESRMARKALAESRKEKEQ
jgi:hypothetical protein